MKDGKGQETFNNGNKYVGNYAKNKFHGKGKLTYKNQNYYEGEWKMGKKHGTGIETFGGKA